MPQVETKRTTIYKFDYEIIGDFVVVNRSYGPKQNRTPNVVLLSWFNEQREKKRGWRFLMNIPQKFSRLLVVSAAYFKLYQEGMCMHIPANRDAELYVDPANYLRKHKTVAEAERLVKDQTWNDGWLYDVNDKIVWSRIHFDQIQSPYSTSHYDLEKLIPMIKDTPGFCNPRIEEIPHYNQSHYGEKRVIFEFEPSEKDFYNIIAKTHRGGLDFTGKKLSREWFDKKFYKAKHGHNLEAEQALRDDAEYDERDW